MESSKLKAIQALKELPKGIRQQLLKKSCKSLYLNYIAMKVKAATNSAEATIPAATMPAIFPVLR